MQDVRDPYGALRQRNYRRYFAGNVLYTLGIEMQAAAVGWDLAERAGSPEGAALALGITGLVQFLPVLLLAIPAGHTADLLDGKLDLPGIGEHAAPVRERVCRNLGWLGLELDAAANAEHRTRISSSASKVSAWVVPTDEELMIARHVAGVLG